MPDFKYCFADTETGSELDLKTYGTPRYAEHKSTFVQLFAYSLAEDHIGIWDLYNQEPMPEDLKAAIEDPNVIFVWWHRFFDMMVLNHRTEIRIPLERTRCLMAQAMSHGLPGSLEKVGDILGIKEDAKKLKEGKALVQFFCKPKKAKDGTLTWHRPWDYPEKWARYKDYARNDVLAMREIVKKLPHWNYSIYDRNPVERDYWLMDQRMNERGMPIDLELAEAAVRAVEKEQAELRKRTREMTNGEVEAASQRDALLQHIMAEYGVELPNMQKATLERLVGDESLPEPLRELLEVRLSTCTTSTAKYKKLLQVTSGDGRLRGYIQCYGAGRTLRDAGRGFQVQNLAKPSIEHDLIVPGIDALKNDVASFVGYDVMELCSSAVRYAIAASAGKKFVIADLSAIEGRVLPWLANEEWKIQYFRDYDAGLIPYDTYVMAYARAFGIDPSGVTKEHRQIGKILELSMGFQGGVGGMLVFINMFNIDIRKMADNARPSIPKNVLAEAEDFFEFLDGLDVKEARSKAAAETKRTKEPHFWEEFYAPKRTHSLDKDVFSVLDSLKRMWRIGHPACVQFWADTETALRNAVEVADRNFYFGNGCYARRTKNWVRLVLPSGHSICYPGMRIGLSEKDKEEEKKKGKEVKSENEKSLVFRGINQFTKQWSNIYTHGGRTVENLVQSFARDIFKYGQRLAEQEGYEIVMPLHDELVAEVPDSPDYSVRRLEQIMATVPEWAKGLQLAAKGFESLRYHKSLD